MIAGALQTKSRLRPPNRVFEPHRLVERGWVARIRDTEDARRRQLSLADSVREELLRLTPTVVRVQERVMAPLDAARRETLLDGCRRLAYADPNPAVDVTGTDGAAPPAGTAG